MSDVVPRLPTRGGSASPAPPPPPPPAPVQQSQNKYSNRAASALARFAQPFLTGSRPPSPHAPEVRADVSAAGRSPRSRSLPGASQTITHKTGISISALDISPQRTHAVIGGKEILKTIRVLPDHSSEEFNLRNAIISYSSTHHVGGGISARHKDKLTVKDVKWSHGPYDQIIATAVANGRIVVYDLHRTGLELCRFQGHGRQVHRLAFNPYQPAWLLSGSQDATVRMWDLRTVPTEPGVAVCGSRTNFQLNSDAVRDVRWSPTDAVVFASATDSGAIQFWDWRKPSNPVLRITAHDRPCYSVDWHPDGRHLVSGGSDRQVKVWDSKSAADRRQKPTFVFRTPQAVLNVRWRPPSWTSELEGTGDWQSFQVVTSYDKEDPRIHLWDLRRPFIPFREFDRYDTPAADLLWHSKDLLWTVGDGGAFTQTDIRYAPQVVNQRPTCSVAWSPSGEVAAFAQKRPRRSTLGLSSNEFIGHEENSISDEAIETEVDEIVDEPLFASLRPRHSKSNSVRTSKSFGSTPPEPALPVLPLEKILSKATPISLLQTGMVGIIAGATMDRETFRYLARQYSPLLQDGLDGTQAGLLQRLLDSLDRNSQCAEDISLLKLAQTWRIAKYAIMEELRARQKDNSPNSNSARSVKKKTSNNELQANLPAAADARHEKMKSRFFKGVIESEPPKHSLSELESASNMTTPLAQPLPDSPPDSDDGSISQISEDIQPLPPSVLSSNHGTLASNDWSSMSDLDSRPVHQLQHRESNDSSGSLRNPSDSPPSEPARGSILHEVEEEQRSAPLAIAGRADWHLRTRPRLRKELSEVDEFDQKLEDKTAAISDYKYFPKRLLSLESHAESAKPGFHRHESTESFPMFSASTASSRPSKSPATSFSSAAVLYDVSESDGGTNGHDLAARNEVLLRTRSDSILTSSSIVEEALPEDELFEESFPNNDHLHLDRPSTPPPLLKESIPLKTMYQGAEELVTPAETTNGDPVRGSATLEDGLSQVSIPITSNSECNNPWSAELLLAEAIRHYHSSTHVDVQSAAHLLQKLHILFEDCENILPTEESEAIFKAYNETLIRLSMYIEAAELRLLCVPSYPAVYEYAQGDTYMNVFCFTCKRPYENPKNDNTRCYRCDTPQEACSICMSLDPPPEWVAEQSLSSHGLSHDLHPGLSSHLLSSSHSSLTEPISTGSISTEKFEGQYRPPSTKGTALWSWCQGCGHGGHLACISTWLKDVDVSEGGCATPGCMHDCGPGPRREHNRNILLEESKKRDSASRKAGVGFVKRDTWTRGESRAVEKVRGMLGVGAQVGNVSPSTTVTGSVAPSTTSSNMVSSPKKVRLVTPSEQQKPQRSGSTRTSLG
ncbi:WD repeat protein [Aspergillus granulosus]|uniref:WD repeat protein n=1 Tax=Aspergillus granulosus TaxID=176169 RepID=A0ABR4GVW7_9EURO